jgi:stress-induced morphogen
MNTHINEIYYQCDHCDYKSHERRRVYEHLAVNSQSIFNCRFCPMVFNQRCKKNIHEKKFHRKVNPKTQKTCECGKTFQTTSSYNQHVRNSHENRKYPCEVCSEVFKTKPMLKRHQMKHKPKEACEICGEMLYQGDSYKAHMRIVHGMFAKKPVKTDKRRCSICGKILKLVSYYHHVS